jgi:hypothetical protein
MMPPLRPRVTQADQEFVRPVHLSSVQQKKAIMVAGNQEVGEAIESGGNFVSAKSKTPRQSPASSQAGAFRPNTV